MNNWSISARRAWIEIFVLFISCKIVGSLSARRAWIEIFLYPLLIYFGFVALRKESVDRNIPTTINFACIPMSLSARRAWIEIIDDLEPSKTRKCRSPQGERG